MSNPKLLYILPLFFFATILLASNFSEMESTGDLDEKSDLKADANSTENFDKVMAVLTHKRCVNCHPAGDTPHQGEDSHLHNFGVVRGKDGHGLSGYTCNTCHQDENNDYSGVPGAPEWAVAPIEMAWEGKTKVEIATQMMDPKRNGGRTPQEVMKHLTEHKLVLWAWDPGVDAEGEPREKPPVPKEEYIKAVKEWIAAGAVIPGE